MKFSKKFICYNTIYIVSISHIKYIHIITYFYHIYIIYIYTYRISWPLSTNRKLFTMEINVDEIKSTVSIELKVSRILWSQNPTIMALFHRHYIPSLIYWIVLGSMSVLYTCILGVVVLFFFLYRKFKEKKVSIVYLPAPIIEKLLFRESKFSLAKNLMIKFFYSRIKYAKRDSLLALFCSGFVGGIFYKEELRMEWSVFLWIWIKKKYCIDN